MSNSMYFMVGLIICGLLALISLISFTVILRRHLSNHIKTKDVVLDESSDRVIAGDGGYYTP